LLEVTVTDVKVGRVVILMLMSVLSDAIAQVAVLVVSPIEILKEVVAIRFLGFTRFEQVIVKEVPT
jgi:hypothetical protein